MTSYCIRLKGCQHYLRYLSVFLSLSFYCITICEMGIAEDSEFRLGDFGVHCTVSCSPTSRCRAIRRSAQIFLRRLPHFLKRRREGRNLERLPMPPALELAAQPIRAVDCTAGCAVRVTSQVLPSSHNFYFRRVSIFRFGRPSSPFFPSRSAVICGAC